MSFLIILKDYLQIIKINYLDNMKTTEQWRDIYNILLKPHNDDILLSLSLQEFMILNEKHKENIMRYYEEKFVNSGMLPDFETSIIDNGLSINSDKSLYDFLHS